MGSDAYAVTRERDGTYQLHSTAPDIDGDDGDTDARSVATVLAAAPVMLRLLHEALSIKRVEFENDGNVNGGDLVDAFGLWRDKVIRELQIDQSSSDVGTGPT